MMNFFPQSASSGSFVEITNFPILPFFRSAYTVPLDRGVRGTQMVTSCIQLCYLPSYFMRQCHSLNLELSWQVARPVILLSVPQLSCLASYIVARD